jgi:hypothetical protein
MFGGDFEGVLGADGADAEGFNAEAQVFWRAGGRGHVEDVVQVAGVEDWSEWLADVVLFEAEAGLVCEVGDVAVVTGGKVVNADHSVALAEEAIGEVRTKESGCAGNEYVHG